MSLFTRSTKESESNPRSTTMVFPSLPLYLDPPNWSQQQANHHHGSSSVDVSQLPPGAVAAPRLDAAMAGSIRPGSMADRARHAKIPQPEPGLKCPRCDSTNTKFCYFNNYSLSQPRHFCKTCRRYWTRGGALRNVPVGGGCRRNNKRTKSSGGGGSSSMTSATATTCTAAMGGGGGGPSSSASSAATSSGVPFVTSLHPLPDFAGSNFPMSFSDTADYNQLGGGGVDNWRLQQFSLLGALELPPPAPALGFYHFEGSGFAGGLLTGQQSQMLKQSSSGLVTTQLASMKMEDNLHHHQLLNFPRQSSRFNIDQFWNGGGGGGGGGISGNGWAAADLSRFNSSSSGNLL